MTKIRLFLSNKRNIAILIILLVLIGLAIWKFSAPNSSTTQYQTSKVEKGTIVSTVSASGNVQTANFTPVTTQAGGTVAAVYVKDGDKVFAGQKIMDLTLDRDGQAQNASAYASYLGAQANLNSAQAKINSLQAALFKANQAFVTDRGVPNPTNDQKDDPVYIQQNATWLQSEADYKNQQTYISQAQSTLTSAWLSYQQSSPVITAPTSGTIDSVTFAPGMILTSSSSTSSNGSTTNSSQRVAVIKNDNLPVASVNVSEVDVYKVKTGQPVTLILDSIAGKTFTGKVVSVDRIGSTTSNVTNYPVIIQFDTGNQRILPNMAVTANIIIDSKSDVLVIPSAAIQSETDSDGSTISTVRVQRNGQISVVDVETGLTSDSSSEIISGLKVGDVIVTGTTSPGTTTGTTRSVFSGTGFGGGFGGGGAVRVTGR